MTKNRWVQVVAVLLTLCSLLAAALFVLPKARSEAGSLQLAVANEGKNSLPADISFAVTMLGPMRGFVVNALWYQVEQLKQQGKFAAINELSRTITAMQPNFPEVWRFQAWNMAYNVSVQTYTKEERWDWVNKGIRILRDEGILYNPRAVQLYRELSWIFFHKIGQNSDDAHWYYKAELAREWQEVLGIPGEGRDEAETVAAYQALVDAPETLAALVAANPAVADLIDSHITPAGYNILAALEATAIEERERLLRAIGRVLMYNFVARLDELPLTIRAQPHYDAALLPMLSDAGNRPAIAALLDYLRKRVIIDSFHMDPVVMMDIARLFGPVDYRAAGAHSLYWSHLGIQMMQDRLNKDKVDRINTLRSSIHAIQDLADNGKIHFNPVLGLVDPMPDLRFIDAYGEALEMALDDLRANEQGSEKPYEAGHENFLLKAFVLHYQEGNEAKALAYRNEAMKEYGTRDHNVRSGRYLRPAHEHFLIELGGLIENIESLRAFVMAMNLRAMRALAVDDQKVYRRAMKVAKDMYDRYMLTPEATTLTQQERMGLLPESVMVNNVAQLLREPTPVEFRSRLWRKLPLQVKQAVWDAVSARLKADAEEAGLDPAKSFAEPPDMEAYRVRHPGGLPPLPPGGLQFGPPQPPAPATPTTPTAPAAPKGKGPLRGS